MKKAEIIEALKQGLQVFHNSSKQIVKLSKDGILYSHNFRTGIPYELTVKDFEDCFNGSPLNE